MFYYSDLMATGFVDVLGYRSALEKSVEDPQRFKNVTSAKNNYSFWFYRRRGLPDISFRSVEDGYVFERRASDLYGIYRDASALSCLFLMQGVLTRGGIDISDPVCNGKVITTYSELDASSEDYRAMQGQALFRAHEIESKSAKNAVIQISQKSVEYGKVCLRRGMKLNQVSLSTLKYFIIV